MCPPINHGPSTWWCGDSGAATPCQDVKVGRFVNYTGGVVLGFPAYTSSASSQIAGTTSIRILGDSSSVSATVASTLSATTAPASSQTSHQNSHIALAIGVGTGVPLGVSALGLLSFLFWRETKRTKVTRKADGQRSRDDGHKDDSSQCRAKKGNIGELPNSQMTAELDPGTEKVELANDPI